jgi:hypothetical protein
MFSPANVAAMAALFGGGGTPQKAEYLTLNSSDEASSYKDLAIVGDVINPQYSVLFINRMLAYYGSDYTVVSDGTYVRRINWLSSDPYMPSFASGATLAFFYSSFGTIPTGLPLPVGDISGGGPGSVPDTAVDGGGPGSTFDNTIDGGGPGEGTLLDGGAPGDTFGVTLDGGSPSGSFDTVLDGGGPGGNVILTEGGSPSTNNFSSTQDGGDPSSQFTTTLDGGTPQ